jgi:hypothetical protein
MINIRPWRDTESKEPREGTRRELLTQGARVEIPGKRIDRKRAMKRKIRIDESDLSVLYRIPGMERGLLPNLIRALMENWETSPKREELSRKIGNELYGVVPERKTLEIYLETEQIQGINLLRVGTCSEICRALLKNWLDGQTKETGRA